MISLTAANTQVMDQADALKVLSEARDNPEHPFWKLSPEEQRQRYYLKAHPPAPSQPAPAQPPPTAPPPTEADSWDAIERDHAALVARANKQFPQVNEAQALALVERRRALLGAKNTTTHIQDDDGRVRDAPNPDEQPPVSVADADLPPIRLPEGVSPEDPTVRSVRQLGVVAEVAPAAVEGLVTGVHGLLQTDLPDEDTYWKQSDAVVAVARQKYGARFPAFVDAMNRGRTFVEQHDPALKEILEDPMAQKDLRTAEILAHIGSMGRRVFVRKYGTKTVARIR